LISKETLQNSLLKLIGFPLVMQQQQRNPKIARDKTRVSSDLLSLYDTSETRTQTHRHRGREREEVYRNPTNPVFLHQSESRS
jgi:hypothetical protein